MAGIKAFKVTIDLGLEDGQGTLDKFEIKTKTKVDNDLKRLVQSKPDDFTNNLYKYLSLHCEFIAHFDRAGFHATYFTNPEMTVKFVNQFNPKGNGMSVEYRSDSWLKGEHADINEAMRTIMSKYALHIVKNALTWDREMDIREIERLMKKHCILTYTIKS